MPAALTLAVLRSVPAIPQQCPGLEGLSGRSPITQERCVWVAAHRPSQNTLLSGQVSQKWLQAAPEAPAYMSEPTAASGPARLPSEGLFSVKRPAWQDCQGTRLQAGVARVNLSLLPVAPSNHPGSKRKCPTPQLTPQDWGEGTAGAPSWWDPGDQPASSS